MTWEVTKFNQEVSMEREKNIDVYVVRGCCKSFENNDFAKVLKPKGVLAIIHMHTCFVRVKSFFVFNVHMTHF